MEKISKTPGIDSDQKNRIDAKLKDSREVEKQLLEASKNSAFIKKLVDKSLQETVKKAETLTRGNSQRAKKQRTRDGLSPSKRAERNQKIISDFKKSKLTASNFAEKKAKTFGISSRTLRKILQKAS